MSACVQECREHPVQAGSNEDGGGSSGDGAGGDVEMEESGQVRQLRYCTQLLHPPVIATSNCRQ